MSAESIPETTPVERPLAVAPDIGSDRRDRPWANDAAVAARRRRIGGGPSNGRAGPSSRGLTSASIERQTAGGPGSPDAVSPDQGTGFAIARAMGVVVVTVHGRLDAPSGAVLGDILADLIEGQGNLHVIVDLHDVEAVDPSSVDVLAAAIASAARRGGDLTLADPSEDVVAILEAGGLTAAVTTTSDRRLRSLSPPSHRPDDSRLRRAAMAQHPAGTDEDDTCYPGSTAAVTTGTGADQ